MLLLSTLFLSIPQFSVKNLIFSLKYPQISDIIYMGSYGINTIKDRVSET